MSLHQNPLRRVLDADAAPGKRRVGLVVKIVGLVALCSLVSGGAVGLLGVHSSRSAIQGQVLDDYQAQADLGAEFARRYMDNAQEALRQFAHLPGMSQTISTGNGPAMQSVLAILQSIEPEFENIALEDLNGDPIARAIQTTPSTNIADRDWFQAVLSTHQPSVSAPVVARSTGRPVVTYALPVLDDAGQTVAILAGSISLEGLANSLASAQSSTAANLTLVDRRDATGTILADSDRSRIMQPFDGSPDMRKLLFSSLHAAKPVTNAEGKARLLAVTSIPELTWSLVVDEPSSVALAPVSGFTRNVFLLSLPVLLLACLVSAWLASRITMPLARLQKAVQGLAAGDLRRRLNFSQNDEVGEVGRAFDVMAQALEERTEDLERVVGDLRTEVGIRRDTEKQLQAAHSELEVKVEERTAELKRSNAELEQFAYVASHDLQEPLRMVSNYTQLLARRYQDRLDEDAHTFIDYAVEGAGRMQQLINDLLEFSRVGSKGRELAPVAMDTVLDRALFHLSAAISESGAQIEHGPLPNVDGDEIQLVQLLQNLVGNAIKFHGDEPPRIDINAEQDDDAGSWTFSVRDHGIGIDPAYQERIFVIFQRLHTRADYPGTGIGLAVCKRILERHGGRIWVESAAGEGATFYFTLRAAGAKASPAPVAAPVAQAA